MPPDSVLWPATARAGAVPTAAALPADADVAVIGGGYTGLAAARALARAGRRVVLLEREAIGAGASGRNGGFVLPGYKRDLAWLLRRFGRERARALFDASLAAIAFVERLVVEEGIDCHWRRTGAVTLAARPSHLGMLAAEQRLLAREFGHPTTLLGPGDLAGVIGSARYHGGLLDPSAGALQPVEYLLGLAGSASRAGAILVQRAGVSSCRPSGTGFRLETGRGVLQAGDVLVATNGAGGSLVPWLARRVVPVGSFIIATEPLAPELAERLLPGGRVLSDSKHLLYYFRLSPDRRLVFGGRAGFRPEALERSLKLLRAGMTEVFPALAGTPVEFGWGGTLGFTLDQLPHAGRCRGVAYALGYCGHGVACASWLGDQVGNAMAGRGPWPAVADLPFAAVPMYAGRPWFLPLVGAYYRMKDWIG
jgi:glycine/D-amino acid oxidase-like deaminating enzyme